MSSIMSLVDPSYELIDPCPDIHQLFLEFNDLFFQGSLAGCEVKWSPRMFSCAGVCSYEVRGGIGGLCSIRLSQPLLKLRPRKDLVETLLHEMIHAYLFVTVRSRDRDGHGPDFQSHMNRINRRAGTSISIYHSFHDEVNMYKTHWWRCDGACQNRRPFFGYVKRSSNRAPGPNDTWWAQHKASCSGTFIKIREPEGFGEKKKKSKAVEENKENSKAKTLDNFFPSDAQKPSTSKRKSPDATVPKSVPVKRSPAKTIDTYFTPTKASTTSSSEVATSNFPGAGVTLGGIAGQSNRPGTSKLLDRLDSLSTKGFDPTQQPSTSRAENAVVDFGISSQAVGAKNFVIPTISPVKRATKIMSGVTAFDRVPGSTSRHDFVDLTVAATTISVRRPGLPSTSKTFVDLTGPEEVELVGCPACGVPVGMAIINDHLDRLCPAMVQA